MNEDHEYAYATDKLRLLKMNQSITAAHMNLFSPETSRISPVFAQPKLRDEFHFSVT
jgi:hypothetical protein